MTQTPIEMIMMMMVYPGPSCKWRHVQITQTTVTLVLCVCLSDGNLIIFYDRLDSSRILAADWRRNTSHKVIMMRIKWRRRLSTSRLSSSIVRIYTNQKVVCVIPEIAFKMITLSQWWRPESLVINIGNRKHYGLLWPNDERGLLCCCFLFIVAFSTLIAFMKEVYNYLIMFMALTVHIHKEKSLK